MTVMLLTEHHLEFLSLKGGCTGLPESTLVAAAQLGNMTVSKALLSLAEKKTSFEVM